MAKHKRIKRADIDPGNIDILEPVDIFSLGTEDDPCFGKLHDLKAPECMDCGDSEFCAIVKAQRMNVERLKIETTQRFKDIEEAERVVNDKLKQAEKSIKELRKQGRKKMKIILLVSKKFNLDKQRVKNLYDKI